MCVRVSVCVSLYEKYNIFIYVIITEPRLTHSLQHINANNFLAIYPAEQHHHKHGLTFFKFNAFQHYYYINVVFVMYIDVCVCLIYEYDVRGS